MATSKKNEGGAYKDARAAFDDLKIEEKAVFLVESVVHTLARGVEEAGKVVSDAIDGMFEKAEEAEEKPKKTTRKKTTRSTKTSSKSAKDDD